MAEPSNQGGTPQKRVRESRISDEHSPGRSRAKKKSKSINHHSADPIGKVKKTTTQARSNSTGAIDVERPANTFDATAWSSNTQGVARKKNQPKATGATSSAKARTSQSASRNDSVGSQNDINNINLSGSDLSVTGRNSTTVANTDGIEEQQNNTGTPAAVNSQSLVAYYDYRPGHLTNLKDIDICIKDDRPPQDWLYGGGKDYNLLKTIKQELELIKSYGIDIDDTKDSKNDSDTTKMVKRKSRTIIELLKGTYKTVNRKQVTKGLLDCKYMFQNPNPTTDNERIPTVISYDDYRKYLEESEPERYEEETDQQYGTRKNNKTANRRAITELIYHICKTDNHVIFLKVAGLARKNMGKTTVNIDKKIFGTNDLKELFKLVVLGKCYKITKCLIGYTYLTQEDYTRFYERMFSYMLLDGRFINCIAQMVIKNLSENYRLDKYGYCKAILYRELRCMEKLIQDALVILFSTIFEANNIAISNSDYQDIRNTDISTKVLLSIVSYALSNIIVLDNFSMLEISNEKQIKDTIKNSIIGTRFSGVPSSLVSIIKSVTVNDTKDKVKKSLLLMLNSIKCIDSNSIPMIWKVIRSNSSTNINEITKAYSFGTWKSQLSFLSISPFVISSKEAIAPVNYEFLQRIAYFKIFTNEWLNEDLDTELDKKKYNIEHTVDTEHTRSSFIHSVFGSFVNRGSTRKFYAANLLHSKLKLYKFLENFKPLGNEDMPAQLESLVNAIDERTEHDLKSSDGYQRYLNSINEPDYFICDPVIRIMSSITMTTIIIYYEDNTREVIKPIPEINWHRHSSFRQKNQKKVVAIYYDGMNYSRILEDSTNLEDKKEDVPSKSKRGSKKKKQVSFSSDSEFEIEEFELSSIHSNAANDGGDISSDSDEIFGEQGAAKKSSGRGNVPSMTGQDSMETPGLNESENIFLSDDDSTNNRDKTRARRQIDAAASQGATSTEELQDIERVKENVPIIQEHATELPYIGLPQDESSHQDNLLVLAGSSIVAQRTVFGPQATSEQKSGLRREVSWNSSTIPHESPIRTRVILTPPPFSTVQNEAESLRKNDSDDDDESNKNQGSEKNKIAPSPEIPIQPGLNNQDPNQICFEQIGATSAPNGLGADDVVGNTNPVQANTAGLASFNSSTFNTTGDNNMSKTTYTEVPDDDLQKPVTNKSQLINLNLPIEYSDSDYTTFKEAIIKNLFQYEIDEIKTTNCNEAMEKYNAGVLQYKQGISRLATSAQRVECIEKAKEIFKEIEDAKLIKAQYAFAQIVLKQRIKSAYIDEQMQLKDITKVQNIGELFQPRGQLSVGRQALLNQRKQQLYSKFQSYIETSWANQRRLKDSEKEQWLTKID